MGNEKRDKHYYEQENNQIAYIVSSCGFSLSHSFFYLSNLIYSMMQPRFGDHFLHPMHKACYGGYLCKLYPPHHKEEKGFWL